MSKHIGHFELSGDFDPDEITRRLKVNPSWVIRKGVDSCGGAAGPIRVSKWALNTAPDDCGDVADQLVWLLATLNAKSSELLKLTAEFDGKFNVFTYVDIKYPGFWLGRDTLAQLAALSVDVDCKFIHSSEGVCVDFEEDEIAEAKGNTPQHPYIEFEGTKEWAVLDMAITALIANGDVIEQTSRSYIVGPLCKALAESKATK